MSAENFNLKQRINDLQSKLETEKRDYEEMQIHYEEQLSYLVKSKEYQDNELEDIKWSFEKSNIQN